MKKGFTLVELMVVIAIISIMSFSALMSFNSLFDKDINTTAREFASNVKFLFDNASVTSAYIKIEFNFEENKYTTFASKDRVMLFGKKKKIVDGKFEEEDSLKKRAEKIEEEEKNAKDKTSLFETNTYQSVKRFKQGAFEEVESNDDFNFSVKLPENIRIAGVYNDSYEDFVSKGTAEIIIFPNNFIQKSVIVFQVAETEEYMSLIINPLTGLSEIVDSFYEPEKEDDDE